MGDDAAVATSLTSDAERSWLGVFGAVLACPLLRHRSESRESPQTSWETSRGSWSQGRRVMLYTIAVILLILWLLGFVCGYTIGAFIHVLLVIAIVLFVVGLLSGRRVV